MYSEDTDTQPQQVAPPSALMPAPTAAPMAAFVAPLPEPQPSEPVSVQDPPKGARRKSAGDSRQRALILRAARKTLEIHQTDALTKDLLSTILNTTKSADDLAYAAIIGGTKSIQPAADALEILDADALEAGIHAAALGRSRLRAVWQIFKELDVVTGEVPASDAKAAIALVRAISEGDNTALRAELDSAIALAKK
jgi:hypothetical protein